LGAFHQHLLARNKIDEKYAKRLVNGKQICCITEWGAFNLFFANFFATQIIGGAKELVVLL